jgi:isochorismate pyruvate lyase
LYEVRGNIDFIDKQIIKLIAERGMYVKQASKFKKMRFDTHTQISVQARVNEEKNGFLCQNSNLRASWRYRK